MRRSLPSTLWLLRKIRSFNFRCYCCSSPSLSISDSLTPKIPYANTHIPHTHFRKKDHDFDELNETISKTKSENPILTQTHVVESLLSFRNEPDSALECYNWAQKQPSYLLETAEPLCVLLHILVSFPSYHGVVRKLLDSNVSSDSSPVGLFLYDHLVKCSERFDFGFDPWIFNALLTAYARAGRCSDAIDCFSVMLTRKIVPSVVAINAVMRLLIRKNMILEAKKLYDDIVSKGINYDCEAVHILMRASLKEGKVEDAEKYFVVAKAHGIVLDTVSYCAAIRIACNKLDSEGAYKLLCEMKNLGCTPFEGTFTNVICTCVKQGNMVLALKSKEEMMNNGHSLNTVVVTSLMKGYIRQGDLRSALDLFDKIGEHGLCPDKVTYGVMIEGCCSHGNMEKALELNNLMKLAGIQPKVNNVNSLIRGFFRARMPDEAIKLLNDAIGDGIAYAFTYDNVLGWLCKEGMSDGAHNIRDKLAEKGVKLGVDSCNKMLGHGKKGSTVNGLSEVKDMLKQGTACPKSFCEWLAGIIDGEGNIQVNKEGKTSLDITVGLEDLRLLRYIQHMLSGSIKMRAGAKAYRYRLHSRLGMIKLMNCINGYIRHSARLPQVHRACKVLDIPVILPIALDARSNWFAGFFDADGTVDITMNNLLPQLSIRVTNRLLQDVESFKVVFGGNIYFDSSKNGYYQWVVQSRKDVMTMLGYIKSSTFRSHKSRRFFLIEEYYNLYDLKAFNPDSIHHKAWIAFLDKWNKSVSRKARLMLGHIGIMLSNTANLTPECQKVMWFHLKQLVFRYFTPREIDHGTGLGLQKAERNFAWLICSVSVLKQKAERNCAWLIRSVSETRDFVKEFGDEVIFAPQRTSVIYREKKEEKNGSKCISSTFKYFS